MANINMRIDEDLHSEIRKTYKKAHMHQYEWIENVLRAACGLPAWQRQAKQIEHAEEDTNTPSVGREEEVEYIERVFKQAFDVAIECSSCAGTGEFTGTGERCFSCKGIGKALPPNVRIPARYSQTPAT